MTDTDLDKYGLDLWKQYRDTWDHADTDDRRSFIAGVRCAYRKMMSQEMAALFVEEFKARGFEITYRG